MAKLIKEEIQFIENYLIKNGVKYWDVRLELLDHIVSAVEDKIEKERISFNEALLDVHKGFGNNLKIYGIYNDKLMKSGLYADSKGFERLTRQKQKELSRKYRIRTWKELKEMLTSFKFLAEFVAFILLFFTLFQWSPKFSGLIGLVVLMVPYLYSGIHSYKDKSTRKSLSIIMVANMGFLFFSLYNMGFQIFNMYYENAEHKPYLIFLIATYLFYPIIRAQLNTYLKAYTENKKLYNLKFS